MKFICVAAFLILVGCVDSSGFGIFDAYVGEKECEGALKGTWTQPKYVAWDAFPYCKLTEEGKQIMAKRRLNK